MLQSNETVIVMYSTADWDAPYWTNKQHMASELSQLGFKVVYVESVGLRRPSINKKDILRTISRVKRLFRTTRIVKKNIIVVSPVAMPFLRRFSIINIFNDWILGKQIQWVLKKLKFKKLLIWSYHPYAVLTSENGATKCVYHVVDDLTAIPGVDSKAFKRHELRFLDNVDIVFVTSEVLARAYQMQHSNVVYLPNVVDFEHFSGAASISITPPELQGIPRPRIGYVGVLSDFKIDFDLVIKVAKARPEYCWVFIGDEREGQESSNVSYLKTFPNVYFLGHKSYDDLPKFLAGLDVATLPTLINSYTDGMFPMKYYEYTAAGLRIVSTNIAFAASQKNVYISLNSDEFIGNIDKALIDGKLSITGARSIVGENTWSQRTSKMLEMISNSIQ
jgi:hypothetical protein